MKINRHEKAPSAATLEAYEAVNISEDIHMTEHTEVIEKLNVREVRVPVTVELSFTICNPDQEHLLAVRPGIPVTYALEEASCILSELKSSLEAAAMGVDGITPNQAWLLFRAANTAKVIVDSTHAGLEKAQ